MTLLLPNWITTTTSLSSLTQGQSVNVQLLANEKIFFEGSPNNGIMTLDAGLAIRTQSVVILNNPTQFSISGSSIILRYPPIANFVATITINPFSDLSYTLLYGNLPPGLTMSSAGLISGTVGNISSSTSVTYSFTVRISNSFTITNTDGTTTTTTNVSDRTFNFVVNGVANSGYFIAQDLPPQTYIPSLGINAYNFGSYSFTDPFNFTLEAVEPNNSTPIFQITTISGVTLTGTIFNGLPNGISLVGNNIMGIISSDVVPGIYLFGIEVVNQATPAQIDCMITITSNIDPIIQIVPLLTWVTPPGNIGSINEGYASKLFVNATANDGSVVTYSLAPNTNPLPKGLTFDTGTGDIIGFPVHVPHNITYSVTIRASINSIYFIDGVFDITINSLFNVNEVITLSLNPFVDAETNLMDNYKQLIGTTNLYRPSDPNFGFNPYPMIYLLGSLDLNDDIADALEGDGNPYIGRKSFYGPIKLIIGPHQSAVVLDDNGKTIYEVIYRPLYDSAEGAGGFTLINGAPNRTSLFWQDSLPGQPKEFHPGSLENMRYDLVNDFGFPLQNASLKNIPGPNGGETMPEWMASQQTFGDDSTIIGYIPAVVLAYVNPGTSGAVIASLNTALSQKSVLEEGKVFEFDRYYASGIAAQTPTTFDFVLDSGGTMFDMVYAVSAKYFEPIAGNLTP